jgi:nucleotide-binding universal stress UspA family protein
VEAVAGNGTSGTVVCGVDSSETAQIVLETARRLAFAYNSQLVVAHAFDEPVVDAENVMQAMRLQTAGDRYVETRLVEGSPAERLLEIAHDEKAEWLVVGSRGRGALAAGLLGSVSRDVAKNASCPVVIVPRATSRVVLEKTDGESSIVCGVDGSSHALAAARVAQDLGRHLDYRVVLVHATRTLGSLPGYVGRPTTPSLSAQPDAAERETQAIMQAAIGVFDDVPAATFVEAGHPASVLMTVATREQGRLIVIAARGVGAVHAAVLGSVAVSLASSADVPIVVLPEGAEHRFAPLGANAGFAS